MAKMERFDIPGLTACIVRDDDIIWHGEYGKADLELSLPMTETTGFVIASISKSYTATTALQCVERGLLDLDTDVSSYLPFTVRHARHPSVPITLRQLLCHTSNIIDNAAAILATARRGDPEISIRDFCWEYLVPGGIYYDDTLNFGSSRPGTHCRYSNVAVALAGLVVESVSDSFHLVTRDSLFLPLGMTRTAWYYRDFDSTQMAMPYICSGGQFIRCGHWSRATLPAGHLKSTALEMGRLIAAYLNWGTLDGFRMLDSATVALMTTRHANNYGLGWIRGNVAGRDCAYHNGMSSGTTTLHTFCRDEDVGTVVLCNVGGDSAMTALRGHITRALYDHAQTVGVQEETAERGVTRSELRIPTVLRGPELARLKVRVWDATGREVTKRRERLAPGLYFVSEQGSSSRGFAGSRVRKVVVQR